MKRILTVQDISCLGKCSLTLALPVISAMGIEACPLPTAILSTHTAFKNFTFHDLTNQIKPITEHWKNEKIHFNAIYTGYLGSKLQIDLMCQLIQDFGGKDVITLVDPCMADNGKLYQGFAPDFPKEMAKLCSMATVITPNMSEACYLLDIPYKANGYNQEYVENIINSLADLGAKKIVLKGINFSNEKIGIVTYDSQDKKCNWYFHKKFPQDFHGTGDLFASAVIGGLVNNMSLENACKLAADFVLESFEKTLEDENYHWYGVNFEKALPFLINQSYN